MGFNIRHRQGEARPLQQGTGIADLDHRHHPRRSAAKNQGIGREERLAQFRQCLAAQRRDHQKPIGRQLVAQPGEIAGHIIDRLQVQNRNDQVEVIPLDRRHVIIAGKGLDTLESKLGAGRVAQKGKFIDVRPDDEGLGELANKGCQPVGEIVQHQIMHEICAGGAARQMAPDQRMVENPGRLAHDGLAAKGQSVTIRLMETPRALVKSRDWSRRLGRGARWAGGVVLDLLYPPVCLGCDAPVTVANTLCSPCFTSLRPITAPLCPVLGLPFEIWLGPEARSAEALADPPPFGRARAAVLYNEMARTLVSRLKYGDRPELAQFCARLMTGAGHELWADRPILVPVPLHPSRQRERRYNQSAELAYALGRLTGLKVEPSLVRRTRKTRQQVGLSGDGRQRNVQGAFAVHPDAGLRARGQRIVLIDDVYTTGATTKAVTRALLKAGMAEVDVMSFARVVIGSEVTI